MLNVPVEKSAILWDADGVLFHSYNAKGVFYWSQTIEKDLGLKAAEAEAIFANGWHDVLRGTKDARSHIEAVFKTYKISLPVQSCIDYWLTKDRTVNAEVAAFLNPENSYIATNQDRLRTREFEQIFAGRVKKFYASNQIGSLKPEAAYYDYIEEDLGLEPYAIWFIDDSEPNVLAAAKKGWNAHHFVTIEGLTSFLKLSKTPHDS